MADELLKNTYHHTAFSDIGALVELKQKKGLKISLAFPTLNEEATIGKEILIMRTELIERFPLLDEIAIIDSSSKDNTRKVAEQFGARVFTSRLILPNHGNFKGKGENLWKSLYVLEGDLIVWVDADISNISPKFVYALLGPLLHNDRIGYVKAFYERPIRALGGITSSGGGRVTEILVRPLFSLFFPELASFVQPLSGEYAGRRALLEQLPFSVGYGVELGHLIDILHIDGIEALAQVDLDMRIHRNQSTEALGRMSYGILNTFFERAQKYGKSQLLAALGDRHITLEQRHTEDPKNAERRVIKTEVSTVERPPMITVPEYRFLRLS